jgi:alkanesulfonate monooxygenase SsuD/methylene tetrahydromethanopterin reductase-like flavin-dependent oxidoreductase (luciferase family)
MNSRAIFTAIGCLLAVLSLLSCAGGSSKQSATTTAHKKADPPRVSVGSVLVPTPGPTAQELRDAARSPFVRAVNAACTRVGIPPLIPASQPLRDRVDAMIENADWLAEIQRNLLRVHAPAGVAHQFRAYLANLKDQILLDRLIARAARAGDPQAVAIGLRQNQFNRDRRSRIATKLRLARCLRDPSSTS